MTQLFSKKALHVALSLAVAAGVSFSANAEKMTLKQAAKSDMVSKSLETSFNGVALPTIGTARERVTFTQVLAGSESIQANVGQTFTSESRNFKMLATGEELSKGINLPISSPSALVRVIPMSGSTAINEKMLQVNANGQWLSSDEAFAKTFDANELTAAGLESPKGSFAMKMKAEPGKNGMLMRSEQSLAAADRFNVLVFEPKSNEVLKTTLDKTRVVQGENIRVNAAMTKDGSAMALSSVEAFVMAPGSTEPQAVQVRQRRGSAVAVIDTANMLASAPGLFEVHLVTESNEGGVKSLRTDKVAFAVAPKTARLTGDVEVEHSAAAMTMSFAVESVLPGRYEVSAVVYGTDARGRMVPGVLTATAQWLDANGTITLEVPEVELSATGLVAPFEVKSLKLKDQTRLSELWSQESALEM
ncbi:hypothetical protein MAH1_27060 [Sessilibacter sp. MAH1]